MATMATAQEIELARLSMLEARKVLESYELAKGTSSCSEHNLLVRLFTRATETYLRLSKHQR